jgi:hypothetical protein
MVRMMSAQQTVSMLRCWPTLPKDVPQPILIEHRPFQTLAREALAVNGPGLG